MLDPMTQSGITSGIAVWHRHDQVPIERCGSSWNAQRHAAFASNERSRSHLLTQEATIVDEQGKLDRSTRRSRWIGDSDARRSTPKRSRSQPDERARDVPWAEVQR